MRIGSLLIAAWGLAGLAAGRPELPPMIRPTAMSGVFVEGAPPAFRPPEGFGALDWKVLDWRRAEVQSGVWPEGGTLTLAPLPKGYYYLETKAGDRKIRTCTFCIVPDPKTRTYPADSFYGVEP